MLVFTPFTSSDSVNASCYLTDTKLDFGISSTPLLKAINAETNVHHLVSQIAEVRLEFVPAMHIQPGDTITLILAGWTGLNATREHTNKWKWGYDDVLPGGSGRMLHIYNESTWTYNASEAPYDMANATWYEVRETNRSCSQWRSYPHSHPHERIQTTLMPMPTPLTYIRLPLLVIQGCCRQDHKPGLENSTIIITMKKMARAGQVVQFWFPKLNGLRPVCGMQANNPLYKIKVKTPSNYTSVREGSQGNACCTPSHHSPTNEPTPMHHSTDHPARLHLVGSFHEH